MLESNLLQKSERQNRHHHHWYQSRKCNENVRTSMMKIIQKRTLFVRSMDSRSFSSPSLITSVVFDTVSPIRSAFCNTKISQQYWLLLNVSRRCGAKTYLCLFHQTLRDYRLQTANFWEGTAQLIHFWTRREQTEVQLCVLGFEDLQLFGSEVAGRDCFPGVLGGLPWQPVRGPARSSSSNHGGSKRRRLLWHSRCQMAGQLQTSTVLCHLHKRK